MDQVRIPYWVSVIAALIVLAGAVSAFGNERPKRALIFLVFGLGSTIALTVVTHRKE